MATHRDGTPPEDAMQAILDYCLKKGAFAAGVADLEAICAYLDENGVAKVRWPERREVVEAMPLTATRKIIKSRLTKRVSQTLTPAT